MEWCSMYRGLSLTPWDMFAVACTLPPRAWFLPRSLSSSLAQTQCTLCPGALIREVMFCCSPTVSASQTGQGSGHPFLGWPCPTWVELLLLVHVPTAFLHKGCNPLESLIPRGLGSWAQGKWRLIYVLHGYSDFHLALGSTNSVAGLVCWELRAVKQREEG